MNDVLKDKAWLEKMMYIIRTNQWDNRFGTSNLFFCYVKNVTTFSIHYRERLQTHIYITENVTTQYNYRERYNSV